METLQLVADNSPAVEANEKRHLLSDETYQLLLNAQQSIFTKTDMKVTLRKLLDKLISRHAIEQLTQDLILKLHV